jgi:hypothetical protein
MIEKMLQAATLAAQEFDSPEAFAIRILIDVCRTQQTEIERLERKLRDVEADVDRLRRTA